MKLISMLTLLGALTACSSPSSLPASSLQANPQTPVEAPPQINAVQNEVSQYNATREAQGQEDIIPGLSCQLWSVGTGTSSYSALQNQIYVGAFPFNGVFNVPNQSVSVGLNILPAPLQSTYQTWYALRCTGYLVVIDNNWHSFALTSDDGSILSVDGSLINNDGLHSATTKSATKFLAQGVHYFELDYLQGPPSNEALILTEDGSQLDPNMLWH